MGAAPPTRVTDTELPLAALVEALSPAAWFGLPLAWDSVVSPPHPTAEQTSARMSHTSKLDTEDGGSFSWARTFFATPEN
jgi:hypothetical protein